MGAVRYKWMFRTAAAVHLLLGLAWFVAGTFEPYRPDYWPLLLGLGVVATSVGVMLFRRMKLGIALSGIGAAIVSICAAVAAPNMRPPVLLLFAAVAIVTGIYAALAARTLFEVDPR